MKVSIIGTGAYGLALAVALSSNNNNEIYMWTKFEEEANLLLQNRENKKLLPGVNIPNDINISTNLKDTLKDSKVIIIAVPMNAVRSVSKELSSYLQNNQIICIVTKGIEVGTGKRMSEVVLEETGSKNICMLSGPSFAIELAKNNELGLVAASKNVELCKVIKSIFESEKITVSITDDIAGIEICASAKNAFAIMMGMLEGKSDSTRATMLTILLNDLKLILKELGGNPDSIFTFAGIGDFLLTCMNIKSRNYTFGTLIGKGNNAEEAFSIMGITTVEGIYSLDSIHTLLQEKQINVKSIDTLYNILYEKGNKEDLLKCLK